MFKNSSATINGKHTYADYGLYVTNNNPVSPPQVKVQSIEVPGINGNWDLTEGLTGYTVYGNRTLTFEFGGKKRAKEWPGFLSQFLNELHGKRVEVIFDDDPQYYYAGRATVEADYERGNEVARFTMTVDAEPYKYDILSTTDPWLWDSFSFVDGVIRQYSQIEVKGSGVVNVVGSPMPTIPIITASTPMQVEFKGNTYALKAGTNKNYDIVLMNEVYLLTFTGTGTVSIEYHSGRL